MKRKHIVLIIIGSVLLIAGYVFLCFCMRNDIPYQGKRPFDYPPARWISEEPNIWFDVVEHDGVSTDPTELKGQLVLDGEVMEIVIGFNYQDDIFIKEYIGSADMRHMRGSCEFNPDKLIVTVDKENDSLLNGGYDTITFIRIPENEE